ncbi:MAG: DUF262 domain-containing protein [Bacteroidota bacterium]
MKEDPTLFTELEEEEEGEFAIKVPFDPKQVDITVEPATLSKLVDRIKHDEIDLFPEFQRSGNLWDNARMSQLIESILIKLPLPAFYMDVANDDKWVVVDGLQRLSTFKKFMVDKKLRLTKLEFLKEIEGKTYDELDRVLRRRIDETQITLFKIRKGTPKKVLTNLFHRINTGGLKMTAQEIRHALNQGPASRFLNDASKEEWFKRYIRVSPRRMLDRELFLRFIVFYHQGYKSYQPSLRMFLDNEMEYLNEKSTPQEREEFKTAFHQGLKRSECLFGDKMFSKALLQKEGRTLINRSLFETTTVNLAKLSEQEFHLLSKEKAAFLSDYKKMMSAADFDAAITANTNRSENVTLRHTRLQELITKYSGHAYQP